MMLRPDVIVAWPENCDYPLWRFQLQKYRARFDNVVIVFTKAHSNHDYKSFVRDAMFRDHIIFIDSPDLASGEDWRDVATRAALLHSYNAPWIWFTEQDFLFESEYWEELEKLSVSCDAIGVKVGSRIHPCSLLMKRETLNQTRKFFGIVPGKWDHFGLIQEDLERLAAQHPELTFYYHTDSPENARLFKHFNGYSHNFRLISEGLAPNYKPEEFFDSLRKALNADIVRDEGWEKIAREALQKQA